MTPVNNHGKGKMASKKPRTNTGARAKHDNELRTNSMNYRDAQGASEVDPPTLVPQKAQQTQPSSPREVLLLICEEASGPPRAKKQKTAEVQGRGKATVDMKVAPDEDVSDEEG